MRLFAVLGLAAVSLAADPRIFHDEAPTKAHVHKSSDADGLPTARGMDNHNHAAPTRSPQSSLDYQNDYDWKNHKGSKEGVEQGKIKSWTFSPSKFPTPHPTFLPTATPTQSPTAVPTRDNERIIKTCDEIGSPEEVVWYSSSSGDAICKGKINKSTCPSAKRCLLSKTEAGQTYTSTCSHVHCRVSTNKRGQKITQVKHHHLEKFGKMHICQQGLHKDYGHEDRCGCECFDKLAGDNDWLTGLAHRNVKALVKSGYKPAAKKHLQTHKYDSSKAYLGTLNQGLYGHHNSNIWDGSTPTKNSDSKNFQGYKNHEDPNQFGYKNQNNV